MTKTIATHSLEALPDDLEVIGVIDVTNKRPACVLIQAALGGDTRLSYLWPTEDWLVAPTDGMRRIKGTMAQWRAAADMRAKEKAA